MTYTYTEKDLAEASGETNYRGSRAMELNEVSINGDADATEVNGKLERKGGYFRKRVLVGKPRDQKPEEVNLGRTARVVFLKIRRKLVERAQKGEIMCSTNEHTAKTDAVTLFISATKEQKRGIADDLRKAFPGLRTVQIVYALLLTDTHEPELVRLTVKGSALGSEAKSEDVMNFYQYISSFPKSEHMWEYVTELHPVVENGAKSYYTIDFKRGEKLDERTLSVAKTTLMDVHVNCKEVDEARAAKFVTSATVEDAKEEPVETKVEYPKDDISPDDLPF